LSITMFSAARPRRSASQCCSTSRAASGVPLPLRTRPSVRNSCCAITLLLNLLISRTTSASAGETISKVRARAGALPSRTVPESLPAELAPQAGEQSLA